MNAPTTSPSPTLLAANQRLYELRQQAQSKRSASALPIPSSRSADELSAWDPVDDELATAVHPIQQLPTHLGWDSQPITDAIRAEIRRNINTELITEDKQTNEYGGLTADHQHLRPAHNGGNLGDRPLGVDAQLTKDFEKCLPLYKEGVKHYPSIGIAALKEEQATHYRVWLACRYLDLTGRGWLNMQHVRARFTDRKSPLRLFGWRRLRQTLGQGHGRFWAWDKVNGRVWLFGAARVAGTLNVSHLTGRPVTLPASAITAGIGEFKAHLYGAWHSSRKIANPISREQQKNITRIPERTATLLPGGTHRQTTKHRHRRTIYKGGS